MRLLRLFALVLLLPTVSRAAQVDDSEAMKSLIEKIAGEWTVESTLATDDTRSRAERVGRELWKAGPGSGVLIEEYWSNERNLVGHATIWETAPGKFSVLWCDDGKPACRLLARPAHWQGALFVIEDEQDSDNGTNALRETFEFRSRDRFIQRLYAGPSFDKLALIETIEATRRK